MKNYQNPQWLKETYAKFGTLSAIARLCKISVTHVGRQMRKFGIEFRHDTANGYKTHNSSGYVLIIAKGHPGSTKGGYVYEHRLVMEKHLGRLLTQNETVHHINGDKTDNRIENLELMTSAQHRKHHSTEPDGLREFSRNRIAKILSLRNQGWSVKKIAERVSLCQPTITKILVRYPIQCKECKRDFKNLKALGMHVTRYHIKGETKHPRV